MAMKRCRIKSTEEENEEESMKKNKKSQSEVVAQVIKFQLDLWLNLPPEILETIMKQLLYIDLINFRVVCKSWNLFNRGKMEITPSLVQQHPWLVIFDKTTISTVPSLVNKTSCSCQLFDPTYKKLYTIDMSHIFNLRIQRVYESKYGWLLMSPPPPPPPAKNSSVKYMLFALTPFSSVNNFIELPTFISRITIHLATFTCNPSMDQDCLFIVLHNNEFNQTTTYNSTIEIRTCRRGDKSWCTRYLKYSGPVSLGVNFPKEIRWIYSEGNIYNMVHGERYYDPQRRRNEYYHELMKLRSGVITVQNVKLLEPQRIVKWSEVVKSHGTNGESLYGSVMKLDDEDHDDSKYWVSKLRKEFSDLIYRCPYASDCYYGSWDDVEVRRKLLKIYPPPYY